MRGLQTVKPIDMETQNEYFCDKIMVSSHKENCFASGKFKQENNCNVKLPDLGIPVFGGDKIKWKQFWDFFKFTVDQTVRVSVIEKTELSEEYAERRCTRGYIRVYTAT